MKQRYPFSRVAMDNDFSDFMPYLSADTMYLHYDQIYLNSVQMLNALIASYPKLQSRTLEELITEDIRQTPAFAVKKIKYYAGEVYNHGVYFDNLCQKSNNKPGGQLEKVLGARYGNFENFKHVFVDAARNVMGVGWVWLNAAPDGSIHIALTADCNSPALKFITPILALDVWEHAYFLEYQTGLDQYVQSWFEIIDWDKISVSYEQVLLSGKKSIDNRSYANGSNEDTDMENCFIW